MEPPGASIETAKPTQVEGIEGFLQEFKLEEYLINIDKNSFKRLWGDQSDMLDEKPENPEELRTRLAGIYLLFFNFDEFSKFIKNSPQYSDTLKRNNIWYNEIRENTLLNLFDIDKDDLNGLLIKYFGNSIITISILNLYDQWISTLLHCGDLEMNKYRKAPQVVHEEGTDDVAYDASTSAKAPDVSEELSQGLENSNIGESSSPAVPFVINSIQKRGGQKYPYDFELKISETYGTPENDQIVVKIEFKFSGQSKTSIKQLAQFGAANTESAGALTIFGDSSYLDFFWNQKTDTENPNSPTFFQQMCIDVKYPTELSEYNDPEFVVDQAFLEKLDRTLDFDKDTWKTQAKGVEIKAQQDTKIFNFHTYLRREDVIKNPKKKITVNESFGKFIASNIEDPTTGIQSRLVDVISKLFNGKQEGKYFCIFSEGLFSVATLPSFNLTSVLQDTTKPFIFYLLNDNHENNYNIKCDMSWGNGGAGNQNPRILFKLIGGNEEDDQDDVEQPEEELAAKSVANPAANPAAKQRQRKSPKNPLLQAAQLQAKAQVKQVEKETKTLASQAVKDAIAQVKSLTVAKTKAAAKFNKKGGDDSDSEEEEEEEESGDYDWFTMNEELAEDDYEGYREAFELNKATSAIDANGKNAIKVFSAAKPPNSLKHIRERQRAYEDRGQIIEGNRYMKGDELLSLRLAKKAEAKAKEGPNGGKKIKKTKKTNIKKIKKTKRIKKLKKLTKRKNKKNKKTKRK